VRQALPGALDVCRIRPDQLHVPIIRRRSSGAGSTGRVGLLISRFEDELFRVAVTAEMDDLGLVFVELAQQVDRPCPGDQDQLHRIAKRASPDLVVDLPELAGEIER
jgi:hypothetical protein